MELKRKYKAKGLKQPRTIAEGKDLVVNPTCFYKIQNY
jgi:hypothetical protein